MTTRHPEATEIVNPRPDAVGSIRDACRRYSGIGPAFPAMGYGRPTRYELQGIRQPTLEEIFQARLRE